MYNELIEAMNDYYKLKHQYNNTVVSEKNKILKNDTLSSKDKRRRFKQLVYKCINCKQNGGTIFTNTNGFLKAVCGSDTPCKLNIEIMKGKYTLFSHLWQNQIDYAVYVDGVNTALIKKSDPTITTPWGEFDWTSTTTHKVKVVATSPGLLFWDRLIFEPIR